MVITIKDIAAHTGLSFQTVSRILSGKGKAHNEETRERVLQSARELGYRPHSSAKAMRQGRFESVALLLSEVPWLSLLSYPLRDGILDGLAALEINLILARLPDVNLTSEQKMPRILRELTADGLLINYNDNIPAKMVEIVKKHNMPAIWINSMHDADCVYPDDIEAGRIATRRLLESGHTRIAYLHWSAGHYSNAHREKGYAETMREAGYPPASYMTYDSLVALQQTDASLSWLVGSERYTGFICYSPEVALQLLFLTAALGLKVPQDLSVVTFADTPCNILGIDLDTVVLPYYTMGKEAVTLLIEKIMHPIDLLPPRLLLPAMEPGCTVGTPQ